MSKKQRELMKKHGTLAEFSKAVWDAANDLFITDAEASAAIEKYRLEWEAARTVILYTRKSA